MEERIKRYYLKEEEFLDKFYDAASVAAKLLDGEWQPNYACNDVVRKNGAYFLSTGELQQLVFDSASVCHDANGFSSVQIVLRSSKRVVNVRVRKVRGDLIAEKIVDKLS